MRWFLLVLALAGCSNDGEMRREGAAALAAQAGLQRVTFDTGAFVLVGALRGAGSAQPVLTVYIEGDGLAWETPYQLSDDPTPRHPTGLSLAAADGGPAVLYLGRPCQYVTAAEQRQCAPRYWSSHRFAPEVIAAVGHALDDAKRQVGAQRLILVGYSGGGAVAALVAARRSDLAALVTVAAPLDPLTWTRQHDVAPLTGSLDPMDDAPRLAALPQLHIAGARDTVVPPEIIRGFLQHEGPNAHGRVIVVPEADHMCCWAEHWPDLRRLFPTPERPLLLSLSLSLSPSLGHNPQNLESLIFLPHKFF